MDERTRSSHFRRGTARGRRTTAPDVGSVITRQRLLGQLGAAELTLVIAPAGYGKTTLLAEWAEGSGVEIAWLSLTRADRDPVRLFIDLTEALRAAISGRTSARRFASLEPPAADGELDAYVAKLHDELARLDVPLAIVLDDAHALTGATRSEALLDAFIQDAPPTVRLLVSARHAPAFRVPRLQIANRVVILDAAALAFTADETASAIAAFTGNPIEELQAMEVFELTGGWPVAVRLWANTSQAGERTGTVDAGPVSLTEYLTSEVLDSLEPTLLSFVLDASVDGSVCGDLLDHVRSAADSNALLERCFRDGLFLTVADSSRADGAWFTWHQVFVRHVRQVAARRDPDAVREHHHRAAQWWRAIDPAAAVRHALEAGRPGLAAEYASDAWPDLVLAGHATTVVELVRDLPGDLPQEAELRLALAFVEAERGDDARARHELALADGAARRLGDGDRVRFEARSAALSLLYLVSSPAALKVVVDRGRDLIRRIEADPSAADPTTLALTRLCVGMGEVRLQQDHTAALSHLRLASTAAAERGLAGIHLAALAETCIPTITTGRLDHAASIAENVLAAAAAKGWEVPRALAPAMGYLGWYSYWRGDLESAIDRLTTTTHLLHPNDWSLAGLTTYFRALAHMHNGSLDAARADHAVMVELGGRGVMAPYWATITTAMDAELSLAEGERAPALAWAQRPAASEYRLATTTRARILIRCGEHEQALAALDALPQHEVFVNVSTLAERMRAEALFRLQRMSEAQRALRTALDAARPFDLVLPFLIDGEAIRPLLHSYAHDEAADELVRRILALIEDADPGRPTDAADLTRRELATLRGLATGMTLSEIAAAQFVSVNTVKSHTTRVYRKLAATNRRDAVRNAMLRGLI